MLAQLPPNFRRGKDQDTVGWLGLTMASVAALALGGLFLAGGPVAAV